MNWGLLPTQKERKSVIRRNLGLQTTEKGKDLKTKEKTSRQICFINNID